MAHPLRSLFDLDANLIYLNSGTQSICPRSVLDEVVSQLKSYERNPTQGLIHAWDGLWKVQKRLGRFIGAKPEDLFLRPNVTVAMNSFILGAPLPAGSEILISDTEYPAIVNICRYRAERDRLRLRTFHLPGTPHEMATATEESVCQSILAEIRPQTKMLMLSHVMTGTGLALPLRKLARETRRLGVLLTIDGAHSVGALPLDFSELEDVDYYGGNLHKWMMGPKGTGFGWVHPRNQASLEPMQAGWTTFEAQAPHSGFGGGHRFAERHLHSSCVDFAPFLALNALFNFWDEQGAELIRGRIAELQACVEKEMATHTGWKRISPPAGTLRGPLLSYELPPALEALGGELMARLFQQHRIQILSLKLQGRFVIRLSPHIHNSEEEIARAAQTLALLGH